MDFKNKETMSLSDWRKFENDEDYEFAFGTIDFLSNKSNSHSHTYSEEVIKKYAPSVINKWVVAEYSNRDSDATSHTENQKIVGIVPQQEIKYRYDEDGFLIASADVVISKLYATDVYEIFRENNKRAVSIELLMGFTPETEEILDGYGEKIVEGFNITGITILGLKYNPSVPNANIVLTQMSDESAKTMESEYVKYSDTKHVKNDDNKMSEILNKLTSIEEKLSKEEIMAKNKEDIVEKLAEDKVVEVEAEKVAEMEVIVEPKADEPVDEDEPEVKEDEMACGEKEKMAEVESKLAEAEDKIAKYEVELLELKEFKTQIESVKCQEIVKNTLSIAKKVVDETKYTELEVESKECVYASVEEWSTKVLASVSTMAIARMEEVKLSAREDDVVDMGMPIHIEKTKTSIYD